MNQNNRFPEIFSSFINSLNNHGVEYLLIGGFAVGAYGFIRSTGDLDIFFNAVQENADKAVRACIEFGIEARDVKSEMFLVEKMIGIGEPPLRIEIIKKLDSVDFKFAYQRAETRILDGIEFKVISLDDLILLKKVAINDRNKENDREDLYFLQRLKENISRKKKG